MCSRGSGHRTSDPAEALGHHQAHADPCGWCGLGRATTVAAGVRSCANCAWVVARCAEARP